jgi:hypothetical protein
MSNTAYSLTPPHPPPPSHSDNCSANARVRAPVFIGRKVMVTEWVYSFLVFFFLGFLFGFFNFGLVFFPFNFHEVEGKSFLLSWNHFRAN